MLSTNEFGYCPQNYRDRDGGREQQRWAGIGLREAPERRAVSPDLQIADRIRGRACQIPSHTGDPFMVFEAV